MNFGTVCLACNLDGAFVNSFFEEYGEQFLSDYIFGLSRCFEDLCEEKGMNTILTGLKGYGEVMLPHMVLELKRLGVDDNVAAIHCMLEKPGDETGLSDQAKYVWEFADDRSYHITSESDMDTLTLPETMILRSDYLLSSVCEPGTNPFHKAAIRFNVPIVYHNADDLREAGKEEWAQIEMEDAAIFEALIEIFPDRFKRR